MTRIVENWRVIRVATYWNYQDHRSQRYFYLREDKNDMKGAVLGYKANWAGVIDIRDSTNLNEMPIDDAMKLFHDIKETLKKGDTIDLVDLELTLDINPVIFDHDVEREYLQSRAFGKLTEDEVRALGVGNLAIYDKLKNHNA